MVGEVTFAVIGLLFLIADIRTFSSTFQLTFYGQPNTTLAIGTPDPSLVNHEMMYSTAAVSSRSPRS